MNARAVVGLLILCSQILLPGWVTQASADTLPPIYISELQVAGPASASDEFVELYNGSDAPISLSGWSFEYRSAASSSGADCTKGWTKKLSLAAGQTIPGYGFYLMRATGFGAGDATFAPGLATAGTIRVLDGSGATVDALAWGTSACGSGTAAPAPSSGKSLERRPGADAETGGNAYDTNDNAADFMIRAVSGPQTSTSPIETPIENYVPSAPVSGGLGSAGPSGTGAGSGGGSTSAALELNELLPDPTAPLTDAKDEFIELYNPTDAAVNLSGYVIKSGASLGTKHSLPNVTIGPASYLALKSGDTKIALANDGSSVALFGPDGVQIGATVTYTKAKTGVAWARFDDTWTWTNTPTPSAANNLSQVAGSGSASSGTSAAAKSSKASSSSAKSTKTTKAATTKKAKAAKIAASPAAAATSSAGGRWLLFGLAGLTMGYIIYEFRYDLRNFYDKLRGHAGARAAALRAAGRR